jgi:hypothetical protein
MNSFARFKSSNQFNPSCAESLTMGERELSAFFQAVTQLFGAEQAELSAEDWLDQLGELVEINDLPRSTHGWRAISSRTLTRLAARVNVSAPVAETQIAELQIA